MTVSSMRAVAGSRFEAFFFRSPSSSLSTALDEMVRNTLSPFIITAVTLPCGERDFISLPFIVGAAAVRSKAVMIRASKRKRKRAWQNSPG